MCVCLPEQKEEREERERVCDTLIYFHILLKLKVNLLTPLVLDRKPKHIPKSVQRLEHQPCKKNECNCDQQSENKQKKGFII
jgi:hypothetical protein